MKIRKDSEHKSRSFIAEMIVQSFDIYATFFFFYITIQVYNYLQRCIVDVVVTN